MVSDLGAFTIYNQGMQYKARKKNRPIQKKTSSESKLGCHFGKVIIELCLEECSMVGVFWDGEGVPA